MFAGLIPLPYWSLLPIIAYTTRLGPPNARCVDANQSEITNLLQQFIASFPYASNFTDTYEKGTEPLSGSYQLSGTLCVPKTGERNVSHIQFLVHGVGVDSRYWDYTADDDEYSYVSASADAGIATFRYDRLGTGLSEKPKDAYNVVQAATDTAITVKFAQMLRDGSIGIKGQKYNKILGVGHSYGSIVMQAVTSNAPTALDGDMLTGFSANAQDCNSGHAHITGIRDRISSFPP
ncbi:hypothetical protein SERLADRAFT_443276 [Serpula lacrymans var. lacrymans S7.9]|uniref:AB hydrolase-1 domain-containing protein n=1 Tax=Serpula lacrymans var. lacrymans (strain S7.9) TaxID=578457 RepID=F8PC33_SERL9|nr:uncharacterized protein SERLADRAFT_443276 [Serpula lacrymans var. lacrymans S7.9]EGO19233.1 hypothetical protein SERLADRAFT_443276 [Serpula lacrymans var. lacrymans S7.9]